PSGGQRTDGPHSEVSGMETHGGRQGRGLAQLRLHDLRRPESEKGGGEVPQAEEGNRNHQPPETRWQGDSERNRLGPPRPRITGYEGEQDYAESARHKRDPKDGAEAVTGREQHKGRRRSDQRSGGVKCLMKPKCFAQVVPLD